MINTLADRIREARRHAKLTQTQAARLVHVHRGTFGHWERGKGHVPSSANLAQLAKLLEVSYEWLATGRGSMHGLDDQVPTALLDVFAQNDDEETLLLTYRRMTAKQRRKLLKHIQDS